MRPSCGDHSRLYGGGAGIDAQISFALVCGGVGIIADLVPLVPGNEFLVLGSCLRNRGGMEAYCSLL